MYWRFINRFITNIKCTKNNINEKKIKNLENQNNINEKKIKNLENQNKLILQLLQKENQINPLSIAKQIEKLINEITDYKNQCNKQEALLINTFQDQGMLVDFMKKINSKQEKNLLDNKMHEINHKLNILNQNQTNNLECLKKLKEKEKENEAKIKLKELQEKEKKLEFLKNYNMNDSYQKHKKSVYIIKK